MTQPEDKDESLRQFIDQTSAGVDPSRLDDLDEDTQPTGDVMHKLNRSRRRYEWAVYVPIFLFGGFFGLRFILALLMSPEPSQRFSMFDLGICLFALLIGTLVYTKYKQEISGQDQG